MPIERLTFFAPQTLKELADLKQQERKWTCPSDDCKTLTVVIQGGAVSDQHDVIILTPTPTKLE
jgi:hypothetical protein